MRNTATMAYDDELADRVREQLGREKGLTEKRMFGGLAFLINGNMAVAANSKGGLMVRVDPADTESLLTEPNAAPMQMRGREMKGWLLVEADSSVADDELASWVRRGVSYAKSLPPK